MAPALIAVPTRGVALNRPSYEREAHLHTLPSVNSHAQDATPRRGVAEKRGLRGPGDVPGAISSGAVAGAASAHHRRAVGAAGEATHAARVRAPP